MEITKILGGLKDKVLDAANFELLKSAYELQEFNIEQLKSTNTAITENNMLLKEQVQQLEGELDALRSENSDLRTRVKEQSPQQIEMPTGLTLGVLGVFYQADETTLYEGQIQGGLNASMVQIAAALSDLTAREFIRLAAVSPRLGARYRLTALGQKFVAEFPEQPSRA